MQIYTILGLVLCFVLLFKICYPYLSAAYGIRAYQHMYDHIDPDAETTEHRTARYNGIALRVLPHIAINPTARIVAERLHTEHGVQFQDVPNLTIADQETARVLEQIYMDDAAARRAPREPFRRVVVAVPNTTPPPALKTVKERLAAEQRHNKNDTQSVHDSAVSVSFRNNFAKLMGSINHTLSDGDVAQREMQTWVPADSPGKRVLAAMIRSPAATVDVTGRNGTTERIREFDLLRAIHARINHPDNTTRKDNLIEAFVSQLNNSVIARGSHNPVCVIGRTRNVMDALSKIDFDEDMIGTQSKAQVMEMLGHKMGFVMEELEAVETPAQQLEHIATSREAVREEFKGYLAVHGVSRFIDDGFDELSALIDDTEDPAGEEA